MRLHLKVKCYGVGSLSTLRITLLLFTKFFSKKTQSLHFVLSNDMSGAEVEKVTQPFYIVIEESKQWMYSIPIHMIAMFEVIIDHATEVETGPKRNQSAG